MLWRRSQCYVVCCTFLLLTSFSWLLPSMSYPYFCVLKSPMRTPTQTQKPLCMWSSLLVRKHPSCPLQPTAHWLTLPSSILNFSCLHEKVFKNVFMWPSPREQGPDSSLPLKTSLYLKWGLANKDSKYIICWINKPCSNPNPTTLSLMYQKSNSVMLILSTELIIYAQ